MGTWGTGISSNDVFEDIKDDFYNLYDAGLEVEEITSRLINSNGTLIKEKEDSNNFWFALALCQWECKALQTTVLERVTNIVNSGQDLALWEGLGARQAELSKRKRALEKFLEKLNSERKTARKRKKKVLRDAIFQKGDCLTFKLANGNYGGAIVLHSESQTEHGFNLIAVLDIQLTDKPTTRDFESANVLIQKEELSPGTYADREMMAWSYAQFYKKANVDFEVVGQLLVKRNFYFGDGTTNRISGWEMIPECLNRDEDFKSRFGVPEKKVALRHLLRKKRAFWPF